MPRKLPRKPKNTWKNVLMLIYKKYGSNTFTSREVADLAGIMGPDASMRMRRFKNWEMIKHTDTSRHNRRIYELTKYGRMLAKDLINQKGER